MATYVFVAEDGEVIEKKASMKSSIATRQKITRKGKVFFRRISGGVMAAPEFKPYVSCTVPKGMPGCPTDPKSGRTIIPDRATELRVAEQRTGLRPSQQDWE